MAKRTKENTTPRPQPEALKGWKQIAEFLGVPVSVVKRWASEGIPVSEQGRLVTTTPAQLHAWLSRESGKPVQVATSELDLTSELKRGIAFLGKGKKHSAG